MTPKMIIFLAFSSVLAVLLFRQVVIFSKRMGVYLAEATESVLSVVGGESDLPPEWLREIRQSMMDRTLSEIPYFSVFSNEGRHRLFVVNSHLEVLKWLVIRNDQRTCIVAKSLERQVLPELGLKYLIHRIESMPWPDHIRVWLSSLDEVVRTKYPTTIQKMARYAGERMMTEMIA